MDFDLSPVAISVSAFLPFILALINQPSFSKKTKQIIALVAVVLVGVAVPMINGQFDFTDILANTGVCFATMQSVYAGLAKTGIWDDIMSKTSRTQSVETMPNTEEQAIAPLDDTVEISTVEKTATTKTNKATKAKK